MLQGKDAVPFNTAITVTAGPEQRESQKPKLIH